MHVATAMFLAVTLTACGDFFSPKGVTGLYVLVSRNGESLPVTTPPQASHLLERIHTSTEPARSTLPCSEDLDSIEPEPIFPFPAAFVAPPPDRRRSRRRSKTSL